MNGKKAKKLRRLVYKDLNYREREYGLIKVKEIETSILQDDGKPLVLSRYMWVNTGQPEQIGTKENPREESRRRIYQYLKKFVKNVKLKDLENKILN